MSNASDGGPKFVKTNEAASRLGLSAMTMRRMRAEGRGPAWNRFNNNVVRYEVAELDAWVRRSRVRTRESEPA